MSLARQRRRFSAIVSRIQSDRPGVMASVRTKPILMGETWRLALQALRANKFRTMLTMLGVIIGSACIVLVVTVALTGKRYIIVQIEGVGANLVFGESIPVQSRFERLADEVTPADLEAIKSGVPQVVETAGTNDSPMTMVVNGKTHPIHLVGVTPGFDRIRRLLILRGRYFDYDDLATRSKVCVLTEPLATALFPVEDPVGKTIRVGELYFTVIGVFKERISTFGQAEITSESILVPFSMIKSFTGTEYFRTFYVQADRPEDVPGVTKAVAGMLQSRHRPGAKYSVQNLNSILEAVRMISIALTVLLLLMAFIALTISGIGIMNIMLVTVTERTHEIGIRKAVGASRDTILHQFLMEALLISVAGGLLGIAIAVTITAAISYSLTYFPEVGDLHISISWISVVIALVVSCSTGLIFGYLPANRAAQLQPTESLRYEK
jgi:putative ABC transport system permease protein